MVERCQSGPEGRLACRPVAALHVGLYDVALKTDRQAYREIRAADIALKDATGAVLANARAEGPLGCFAAKSRWTMTWIRRVRYAGVSAGDCRIDSRHCRPVSWAAP
jgi:hypothetical protein